MPWGKPKQKKFSYLKLEDSAIPFRKCQWKLYSENEGCIALLTDQEISLDDPLKLKTSDLKFSKQSSKGEEKPISEKSSLEIFSELIKLQEEEKALKKKEEKKTQETLQSPHKDAMEVPDDWTLQNFHLEDIAEGMKAMKWPVAARLVRRWFSGSAHTIEEDDERVDHPIDDSIELEWVLGFGSTRKKHNNLISKAVYSENALKVVKRICEARINSQFTQKNATNKNAVPEGFSTANDLENLQNFHKKWQFQHEPVEYSEASDSWFAPNEIVAIIGGFALYAAIGTVHVTMKEKYPVYSEDGKTKHWRFEPVAHMTHVYVYMKDLYEFTDKSSDKKSQYLGHWNKYGVIITNLGGLSEFDRLKTRKTSFHFDDSSFNARVKSQDLPVGLTKGGRIVIQKEYHAYWPIFNSTFRRWREKNKRGQDFVVMSPPVLVKLDKAISWKMETVLGKEEPMNGL